MARPKLDVRTVRLTPPATMGEAAANEFAHLVKVVSPAHFCEADLPLLVAYAESIVNLRLAQERLDSQGQVVNGKLNPWASACEKSVRSMVALSLRLRLSPSSRYDPGAASRSTRPQLLAVEDRHPLLGGKPLTGLASFRK